MIVTKEQYSYVYQVSLQSFEHVNQITTICQVLSDWTEDLLKLEMTTDAEKTASTDNLVP